MNLSPRRWWLLFACACAWPALGVLPAHASTRNYLTVEGRVFDHLGRPLADAWVICTGSRRASVAVDSVGRYRLEIPGATLEELERAPLKIRIQARKKGYRFALSNGSPELGLDMRVVKDEGSLSRLRVRSNDSSAVSAVANSVVLDANPRALLTAQFVGSPGAQYDTPPVPLEESDEITLAGAAQSIPELAASEPIRTPPMPPVATRQPAAPPMVAPQPSPAPVTIGTPGQTVPLTVIPQAASSQVGSPSGAQADSVTRIRMPVVKARVPAAAESEPRKWNAAGSDRDAKPRVVRPALDPEVPIAPREKPHEKPRETAARAEDLTKRPAKHAGPFTIQVHPPPRDSAVASTASPDPGATPHESPVVAAPRAPAVDSTPAAPSLWTDRGLRPVLPKDMPAERVTPAPQPPVQPVPSAPGVPVPGQRRPAPGKEAPMCDCTIRGTVEVQWDRPLTSRTEVVIAVEDAPDVSASAELFMGSPRAFEIHPAPCGVHRLLLWTRSKQRFVLVSQEPRVVCTPGGVQQMRLVLEPVARWGASQ